MSGSFLRNILIATPVCYASTSNIFLIAMYIFDLVCRQAHATDPSHHVSDFSVTTSTSGLRKHLFTDYIAEWITSCDDLNIPITAAAAVEAIRKFRKEPETTPLESEHPQYSKEAFIDAIVDFVVGDDLVCCKFYFMIKI
jgi:hypothetical protein